MLSPLNSQPLQFSLLQQMLNTFRYLAFWLFCWECRFIQSHSILSGSKNSCPTYHFVLYFRSKTKNLSIQFRSVAQSCLTLWDPMNRSTPGLPVHHQLPESTQTHVHRVGDAIQPSHPLSSPSPPAPNPSQHQGLFQWVSSLHQVAKVLEFQLQHQSFQWTPRTDLL